MNELKKIIVSYNTNEILIELDIDKNKYEIYYTFIKILCEKLGEEDILNNFDLMPLNTKIPYILIDENNFHNIIEEEIDEDILKIFMKKKEINEEEGENEDFLFEGKNRDKRKNNDDIDDFSDSEEEIINNKENKNNGIKDLIVENVFNQKEIKNEIIDDKNNINNEINIKKELDDIFLHENLNINEIRINENQEKKEKKGQLEKEEKVKERTRTMTNQIKISDLFRNNFDKDKKKEKKLKNTFENELCMKCNSPLLSQKNICLICSNTILCTNCEKKHDHPCLIFKSNFFSSLKESFDFMAKKYNFDTNTSSKKLKMNLSLCFIGDKDISLRPDKGVLLPVKILNNSNNTSIFSSDIIMVVKGNKFLDISYDMNFKFKISPNNSYILNFKCLTPKNLIKESITIEIFSNRYILKENKNNKISLNITVNEDKEEEDINLKLGYNELVMLYNKEHKKILASILENELKDYKAEEIVEMLIQNNWNKEKFLKNFFKLKNKK